MSEPAALHGATTVPMIVLRDVQKHFGALHVLKNITLDVPAGQVMVVLGPMPLSLGFGWKLRLSRQCDFLL